MRQNEKTILKKILNITALLIYSFILEKVALWGGLNFTGEATLAVSVVFKFLALLGYSVCIYEYILIKTERK